MTGRHEHEYERQTEDGRGELEYGRRFCERLLRRTRTRRYQRVLCERCGGQVDRRNGVWVRLSASTRRVYEGRVLHLECRSREATIFNVGRPFGENARVRSSRITQSGPGPPAHELSQHSTKFAMLASSAFNSASFALTVSRCS